MLTQEHQLRCFENVAAHLTEDGCFVVEGIVPNSYYRLREGQYADAEDVDVDSVKLDVGRYDPVTQLLEKNHVSLVARWDPTEPCRAAIRLDLASSI